MKTMTCKQLGGACELEFNAKTFDEIAELSKQHGTKMMQKGEASHIKAMNEMKDLMSDPKAVKEWFDNKKKKFKELPHT